MFSYVLLGDSVDSRRAAIIHRIKALMCGQNKGLAHYSKRRSGNSAGAILRRGERSEQNSARRAPTEAYYALEFWAFTPFEIHCKQPSIALKVEWR